MPNKDRYLAYTYDTKGNLIGIDEASADARAMVASYRYENGQLISTTPSTNGAEG